MKLLLILCAASAYPLFAQTAEVATKEGAVTFKSGVNLVPVPVVVRDAKGHAVGNLGIEDFQLFDNGKPQMISKFSMEKIGTDTPATATRHAPAPSEDKPPATAETLVDANTEGIPDRFVAYLFDDLHMTQPELYYTRNAAKHQIESSTHALERVAIYTTSGQTMQEFTSDKEKIDHALAAISTGRAAVNKAMEQNNCPPVSFYMGDQIYNRNDTDALNIAIADAAFCAPGLTRQSYIGMATAAAAEAVAIGDRDSEASLGVLRAVVTRMAGMPGQRTLVTISPGFLVLNDRNQEQTALIERAIRANVVIGALDSRGLYTENGIPDASEHNVNPSTISQKALYRTTEASMQADVMASLAYGTGGNFYHNSNDYDEGIARTAAVPDYIYVLGFSPVDLKLDGKYHSLKVTLKNFRGMDLQVRKGYFAPKYAADPAEQAKQQMEEAFFSRDEVHDLPAVLQTQYSRAANGDATLSTLARVDVKKLNFRRENGRNLDNLTVITGLFDNDGNYVTGMQKVVELKLLDETLEKRVASGIGVKTSFPVHSGRYVVRMVVRDSEGQLMSAQSSLVEIP